MGNESLQYLVEGAKLICVNGSGITQLKIPKSHNYTSGGKKKANCKDCIACDNIPYFGKCQKNEDNYLCEGFMALEERWENTAVGITKAETVSGEEAITMKSVLLCKKGGIIMPLTSGQGYNQKINWKDFLERYQKITGWAAGKNLISNIFKSDPININTGNYIYEKESLFIDGSMPLSFSVFYNAINTGGQGVLGEGWNHNYEICLMRLSGDDLLEVILGDGCKILYHRDLGHKYISIMGDSGELRKTNFGYKFEIDNIFYEFDYEGRLLEQKDSNDNSLVFSYNKEGLLANVKSSSGGALYYTYNKHNRLIYVSDHTERKITIKYQYGRLRWITNAAGGVYEYRYNENGTVNEIITPREVIGVKNIYDGASRVTKQILPNGSIVELKYDDKNKCTYMKDQNGNMLVFESDSKMRNIRTIYEDGEEKYVYNDKNLPIRFIDKKGNTTKYSYDNHGNLTQVINALGEKVCMTYDSCNHLTNLKFADNSQKKFFYNNRGQLIRMVNQLGDSYSALYDNNRVICVIQPDQSRIQFDYDSRGNLISETNAFGQEVSYKYDDLNQIIQMTDGNFNTTHYFYDSNGNLTEAINAMGNVRKFEYNESGKVISITDFDGEKQSIEYDNCNRPCSYTDSEGNTTYYQYDNMGNISKIVYPNEGVATYIYNKFNQLKSYTDGKR